MKQNDAGEEGHGCISVSNVMYFTHPHRHWFVSSKKKEGEGRREGRRAGDGWTRSWR